MLAKYNYLVPAWHSVVTSAAIFTVSDFTACVASICSQNTDDVFITTIHLKMEECTDAVQKEIPHLNSFFPGKKCKATQLLLLSSQ